MSIRLSCLAALLLLVPGVVSCEGDGEELGQGSAATDLDWPELDPFTVTPTWEFLVGSAQDGSDQRSPAAVFQDFLKFSRADRHAYAEGRRAAEKAFGPYPEPAPGSSFSGAVSDDRRLWLQAIPVLVFLLGPLEAELQWSDSDLELAQLAAEFLASRPEGPRLAFRAGESAENHQQLMSFGNWFRDAVEQPAIYAHMIATVDDGPWTGLPRLGSELLETTSLKRVDDRITLSLHADLGGADVWTLQGIVDGELSWTLALSEVHPEADLQFLDELQPNAVGGYGWIVPMRFGPPGDREIASLYLSPEGDLLFYFLSW